MLFSQIAQTIALLVGGVGIFFLGLRFLSMGLQTIAGPTLQKLIGKVTNHRVLGVLVGMGVTCLVQSSAVTMAMVIGFVNAGIMKLSQTLGVIMGANIGTTITGWVLVLNMDQYGMPLAGACALVYCFAKKENVKYSALALLGVGFVFVGLYVMKGALAPVSNNQDFLNALAVFNAESLFSICACIVVGFLMATIMQSSSASLGVTIVLASQGLIGFNTAAALVLGQNIGCTISALMIAANTSRHARRAAIFHLLFNIFGVIWVTILFSPTMSGMCWLLRTIFGIENPDDPKNVMLAIALYHTTFNVVNTLVVLPFTGKIPALLDKLFSNKVKPKHAVVTKLEPALIKSPFAAITQSGREMGMMNQTVCKMLKDLRKVIDGKADKATIESIFEAETKLDSAQTEVIGFLTGLLSTSVSKSIANDAERQLRMSDDLETASDYVTQVLKLLLRMRDRNVTFDKVHQEDIVLLHESVEKLANDVTVVLENPRNVQKLADVRRQGHEITEQVREYRARHWGHVAEVSDDPLLTTTFTDLLGAYRKIKEHLVTATQALGAEIIDEGRFKA